MTPNWSEISKLSTAVVALGVLVYALNMWQSHMIYTAETDRRTRDKMAQVIIDALNASREDARTTSKYAQEVAKEIRRNDKLDKQMLASLNRILQVVEKDKIEQRDDFAELLRSIKAQTKSIDKVNR